MTVDLTPYKIVVREWASPIHPDPYEAEIVMKDSSRPFGIHARGKTPERAVERARAYAVTELEERDEAQARIRARKESPIVLEVNA